MAYIWVETRLIFHRCQINSCSPTEYRPSCRLALDHVSADGLKFAGAVGKSTMCLGSDLDFAGKKGFMGFRPKITEGLHHIVGVGEEEKRGKANCVWRARQEGAICIRRKKNATDRHPSSFRRFRPTVIHGMRAEASTALKHSILYVAASCIG